MSILRDMNVTANGHRDSTDPYEGVLASAIQTGFALPSFLFNDIDAGFPNRRYSVEILTLPSAGKLYLDKTGAGTFLDAPDGVYTGTMRVRKYDVGVGLVYDETGPYSLTVGAEAPPVDPPEDPPPQNNTRTVSVSLAEVQGQTVIPSANLTGIMMSFHAASGPHETGAALYQSASETTDASGVMRFSFTSASVAIGSIGLVSALMPDGRNFLGLAVVN